MKKRLALLIALQVAVLLCIVGKYVWVDRTGEPVTLKTEPVDPRDLMYGDYVNLYYEISRIDLNRVSHDLAPDAEKQPVYVLLERRGQPWHEVVAIYRHAPEVRPGQIVLKGTLRGIGGGYAYVRYGIERYYIPEGTGKQWEVPAGQLRLVDLKVSASGDAVIKQLRMP